MAGRFEGHNYSFLNEDPTLEMKILEENANHVVTIAGSGQRVLPLFYKTPQAVTCVDLSLAQLSLTELRIESIRQLPLSDYLLFWGFDDPESFPKERQKIFEDLSLSSKTRSSMSHLFQKNHWNSLLYTGKWEKRAGLLSLGIKGVVGKKILRMTDFSSLEEQRNFLETQFPKKRWTLFIFLYSQIMRGLWKAHPESFPHVNTGRSFYQMYKTPFERMFFSTLGKSNTFLQILLSGRILKSEAFPFESSPTTYSQIQKGISNAKINYHVGDIISFIRSAQKRSIDFVSFSNAPSYFPPYQIKTFLSLCHEGLSKNARIVVRNFLHTPQDIDQSQCEEITNHYQHWIDLELTQSYDIRVYQPKFSSQKAIRIPPGDL